MHSQLNDILIMRTLHIHIHVYKGSLRKDIYPKEAAGWLFDASKHGVVEAKAPIQQHHHSTFSKFMKSSASGRAVI